MPHCETVKFATKALTDSVNELVAKASLDHFAAVNEFIRCYVGYDLTDFLNILAWLVVLCFVQEWIVHIIHFVTKTIPRAIRRLLCGKIDFCLLRDCDENSHKQSRQSRQSRSSCSSSSSDSSSSSSSDDNLAF